MRNSLRTFVLAIKLDAKAAGQAGRGAKFAANLAIELLATLYDTRNRKVRRYFC